MGDQINLDYVASQHAHKIVDNVNKTGADMKTLYNLATKALGVLQEQGVYAMVLFLLSRSKEEKNVSKSICSSLYRVLEEIPGFEKRITVPSEKMEANEILKCYSNITNDLDMLLLVRVLYEKILVYTRYGAKAVEKENEPAKGGEK
ncbi:MAG: hypothetical protein AYK19_19405 [Theionarchaea archaeon DG-70-1]|nr:MAG: hypothetical protein AYK19_19405 [Theionarchaea archaeon DG-70-1]